jgi:hypothetical protein
MTNTKRNWLIGGSVAGILSIAALIGLWPESPPPAPPKPPITVMPVQMPPPPPEPSPEQLAAAEQAAEQTRLAEAKAKAKLDAKSVIAKTPEAKAKPAPITKKKVTISKGQRSVTQVVVQPTEEPAKPKEVRFNMSQDGKKMTAEDFDAWMKAQGIRIVPAKPAASPSPSSTEQAKADEK